MLFDSSIRKDLGRSFGATLLVLITVVITVMLIRTLGQASKGSISPSDVLLVMGFTVLGHLSTILTLSLFLAVVSVLSRMYRDSEMVIWFTSGQGVLSVLRPMLRFAWPVLLVVAALTLLVWPWSNQQILQLRTQFEQRSDVDRIAPGEFQESSDGSRVIFVDRGSATASPDTATSAQASNIFMLEKRQGREYITSARQASVQSTPEGVRLAVLMQGQRVEIPLPGQEPEEGPLLRVTHFDQYRVQINDGGGTKAAFSIKATPTHVLWQQRGQPRYASELGWRISQPLVAFNLLLLGLGLTVVNPRSGHSTSLALALLAFIVYYNLVTVGVSRVAAGHWSMLALAGVMHAVVFVLAVAALLLRHHQYSPWLRLRRGGVA